VRAQIQVFVCLLREMSHVSGRTPVPTPLRGIECRPFPHPSDYLPKNAQRHVSRDLGLLPSTDGSHVFIR